MAAIPQNGANVLTQAGGSTVAIVAAGGSYMGVVTVGGSWIPQQPTLLPLTKHRVSPTADAAEIARVFNQSQERLQTETAPLRTISSVNTTTYAGFSFVQGTTYKIAHNLGSANVTMEWGAPHATPGILAGNFGMYWEIDANIDFVSVTPWGTFVCDVTFRILPQWIPNGLPGPLPIVGSGGSVSVPGTGVVLTSGGSLIMLSGGSGLVLTGAGSGNLPTYQPAAAFNRFTPIDANTYLYYTLDEAAASYNSTGSNTSVGLLTVGGTPVPLQDGIFNTGLAFTGTGGLTSGASGTSAAPATLQALTVSCWINPQTNANAVIFTKLYNPTGVGLVWSWLLANAASGQWYVAFTIGAATTVLQVANPWCFLPLNEWSMIAMVYDGAHLSLYTNGILAITTALTGDIDYGTNGPYQAGGLNGTSSQLKAILDDLRVEGVVRSASYLRTMYLKGINRT